uniref:Ig-like domain-containing protein n=1 Tax=Macrostomum lignano TaxID=282301 RepID=A0A1I8FBW6_9PLAT
GGQWIRRLALRISKAAGLEFIELQHRIRSLLHSASVSLVSFPVSGRSHSRLALSCDFLRLERQHSVADTQPPDPMESKLKAQTPLSRTLIIVFIVTMERLHQLLGLLLVCFRVTGASIDCSAEQRTVTVQLSRADVLRTWQPSGAHCRWWESRQSETNRFPAAVRSGPRWLVMQLRQPMMLEAVSVRDWVCTPGSSSSCSSASVAGSARVSAVGASSLPLELQLEDPCRASWETFSTRGRWKRVVAGSQALISFIRLTSESSLSWQALSITGRQPPVRLNARLSSKYLSHSYGLMVRRKVQSRIALFIDSCIGNRIVCWLLRSEGRLSAVHIASSTGNQLQQTGVRTAKFELVIGEGDHDSVAQCALAGDSPGTETVLLEEPLLWEVPARTLNLSVSQILIIGFEAVVSLTSESFPEARHRCSINRSRGSHRNLSITRQKISRAIDLRNRAVIRVQSEFRFTLEAADLGGEIVCSGEVVSNPSVTEKFPLLRISGTRNYCI